MKRVKKVKMGLDRLSVTELIAYAQNVKNKLDESTTFDPMDAQITALAAATTTLITRNNDYDAAVQDAEQKRVLRDQGRVEVENLLTVLGAGVEHVAAGDTTIVLASGFDVRGQPNPVGPLEAPQNLPALMADMEGQINLRWNKVRGASSYLVEYVADSGGVWTVAGASSKTSYTLTGLESGKKYRVRVRGIGAVGPGPWSDEAVKMAA